jgi:outer membrane protein assembly factor BamB
MHQFDTGQDGYSRSNRGLDSHTVSNLRLRTTVDLGNPYTADAPVISDGVLYVTGNGLQQQETLYAFDASCRTTDGLLGNHSCSPLWTASVGYNAQPRVAVGDGMVFVASSSPSATKPTGRLWAFPVACREGGAACAPAWTHDFPTAYPLGAAATISGHHVFVTAGFGPSGGAFVYAFPTRCGAPRGSCAPAWRAPLSVGSLGSVAVAGGVVYVTDYGDLRAFAADCGTGGGTCAPLWIGQVGIVGPPTVDDGRVFVSGGGFVWAFSAAGCGQAQCSPLWRGGGNSDGSSAVAAARDTIFLVSNNGTLYALPERCRPGVVGVCPPTWTAQLRDGHIFSRFTTPAVVGDVVFVTWTTGSKAWAAAFDTRCHVAAGPCPELWKGTAGYFELLGPAIVGDRLYFGGGPLAGPGKVFQFAASG